MTSERSGRVTGPVGEDRPVPVWAGDVHAGVEAWTRSSRLSKSGSPDSDEPDEPFQRVPARRSGRRSGRSRDRASARPADRSDARTPAPPDKVAQGPDADPEAVARKILLDALTGQARSRKELADKLAKKAVPSEIAERLLDRFTDVGLIDDEAFATAWIESRRSVGSGGGKGLARRALAHELRRKGIDDEVARDALDEIDPDDEEAAARVLVRRKLRSLRGLEQQKATRRLVGMLARKGYGASMAFAIVKDELRRDGDTETQVDFDADPCAGAGEEF